MKLSLLKLSFICSVGSQFLAIQAVAPWLLSKEASENQQSAMNVCVDIYSNQTNSDLTDQERIIIAHVKKCIEYSWLGISQILESTQRQIEGGSNSRVCHLLSDLCSLSHTRYLQIGTRHGSTFVAALCNNQSTIDYAVGIDNFSKSNKAIFEKNCKQFLPKKHYSYDFYSADCFKLEASELIKVPINVFFYSGNCSVSSQERAFTHYNNILDNVFVAIIDNWALESARTGTINAFRALNYKVLFEVDLPAHEKALWANGIYIAVIRK